MGREHHPKLLQGKGDALDMAMKALERVLDTVTRQSVDIDKMPFGYVPTNS